jgi:hypothetical protein
MEGRLKITSSSPPTLLDSHIDNLTMTIGLLLLLPHEGRGTIMIGMTHHPRATTHPGVDLHLGQKPKLGGRYTDISLIYISYSVGTLYIHVSLSFYSF